jgi:hypothetical protein
MVCSGEMVISNRLQNRRHDRRRLLGIPVLAISLPLQPAQKSKDFLFFSQR